MTGQEKIYQMITDQIIEKLDAGVVPWDKGWTSYGGSMPVNLISNKAYRGINVLLLALQGFENPYWLTFNQAKKIGAKIKKGSQSTTVIFWKWIKKLDKDTGETTGFPMLRYYRVFNADQCEDISHKRIEELRALETDETPEFEPIEEMEKVWLGCKNKPELTHNESRAYYDPSEDRINMPKRKAFKRAEEYYSTLFHELAHGTGHSKRLNRCDWGFFGSEIYSKEELTAELTAAFVMASVGSEVTLDRSVSYIHNWSNALKQDRKMIVQAAARAQKAADYILNIEPEKFDD
jgi:antirestriction protein ArdC